jgi:hypothetical protein
MSACVTLDVLKTHFEKLRSAKNVDNPQLASISPPPPANVWIQTDHLSDPAHPSLIVVSIDECQDPCYRQQWTQRILTPSSRHALSVRSLQSVSSPPGLHACSLQQDSTTDVRRYHWTLTCSLKSLQTRDRREQTSRGHILCSGSTLKLQLRYRT